MPDNAVRKNRIKNPFTDKVFTVCFVAMLTVVLFGGNGMTGLADRLDLGPGWPELMQGVTVFLLLLFLAFRVIQLGKRARQQ
ncbi:MAG: hypothetical protein GYA56_14410 [Geobacteraceae bacterium]|nr:hypothetical protein [Geobacteraceae bacterium]